MKEEKLNFCNSDKEVHDRINLWAIYRAPELVSLIFSCQKSYRVLLRWRICHRQWRTIPPKGAARRALWGRVVRKRLCDEMLLWWDRLEDREEVRVVASVWLWTEDAIGAGMLVPGEGPAAPRLPHRPRPVCLSIWLLCPFSDPLPSPRTSTRSPNHKPSECCAMGFVRRLHRVHVVPS